MQTDDLEKRAKTEALFREVNERIAETAKDFDAKRPEFICECDDPSCTHRVEASLDEYEEVRADPATFMVVPGHDDEEIERVIALRGGRFVIVEKVQRAVRNLVRHLNPRAVET
ncbi:MAG TPA: hypothetical protein VKP14_05470 [Gaiellaceae bacterium]|nr:hypothetical protein [Gaiellaceae bacterium]